MRFAVALAALAGMLFALPAAAQKDKPEPVILVGVGAAPEAPVAAPPSTDKTNIWLLDLSTGGRVTILLRPDQAPKMVERIKELTRRHFYDGLTFHRANDAPEGMAQGGDPKGDGSGESDLPDVPAEFNRLPHVRGAVSAARTEDVNSANSQFFIMFSPHLAFDQKYTVFGRVIDGMQWVDQIERGEPPANPTKILHAYIASDEPPAYQDVPKAALPAGEKEVTLPGTTTP
jgi:peptidylprolyl isomerase